MGALFSLLGLTLTGSVFAITTTTIQEGKFTFIRFPSKPGVVAVRKHNNGEDPETSDGIEHVSLRHLVETRCKSLFNDFRPLWYLFKYVTT